jgi:pimeloyl-ACP methyl ester carboxylesterase
MVALEAARHLPRVLGCFLIGSVRSPDELPRRLRVLRPATRLSRCVPFGWLHHASDVAVGIGRPILKPSTIAFLRQASSADPALLRWACRAVLTWESTGEPCSFPLHQIHGDRDLILPWRLTKPDVLVRGGGHVISLSHPVQVNDFIRSRLEMAP